MKSLAQRVDKDNDDDDDDLRQKLGMKFVVGNEVWFFLDWSFWLVGWLVFFFWGFGSFGL